MLASAVVMRSLVLLALVAAATAKPKPGGLYDPWGGSSVASLGLVHQPAVAVAQPVVHAAPVYHAPVAIAKPAATSYASFQQVVHPVSVAQPVVHAPVISQPVYHQPVVQAAPVYHQSVVQAAPVYHQPVVQAAPVVQTVAQPVYSKYLSVGSVGHGW